MEAISYQRMLEHSWEPSCSWRACNSQVTSRNTVRSRCFVVVVVVIFCFFCFFMFLRSDKSVVQLNSKCWIENVILKTCSASNCNQLETCQLNEVWSLSTLSLTWTSSSSFVPFKILILPGRNHQTQSSGKTCSLWTRQIFSCNKRPLLYAIALLPRF